MSHEVRGYEGETRVRFRQPHTAIFAVLIVFVLGLSVFFRIVLGLLPTIAILLWAYADCVRIEVWIKGAWVPKGRG